MSSGFRLRDALRDVIRAPRAASVVIAAAFALAFAPLVLYTLSGSHRVAAAADARAAFNAYTVWAIVAVALAAVTSRAAAALTASVAVADRDRPGLPVGVAIARVLAHGVPALLAALLGVAIAGLGEIVLVATALPVAAGEEMLRVHASSPPAFVVAVVAAAIALAVFVVAFAAAAWLAASGLLAGPAAAAEQLAPSEALRRSGALARRAHVRLALWTAGLYVATALPLAVARVVAYPAAAVKKPPVDPILHAQQIHGAILIAVAAVAALAQIAIYRRLRDTRA